MADYKVTDTELTSIANAIRIRGGTSGQLVFPNGFVSAVNAIPSGGGNLQAKTVTTGGVVLPDSGYDALSSVNVQIGDATGSILSGVSEPTANIGSDGDVYLMYSDGYLRSDKAGYIATDIIPDDTTEFEILFSTNDQIGNSGYGAVFGSRRSGGTNEFQLTSFGTSASGTATFAFYTRYSFPLTRYKPAYLEFHNHQFRSGEGTRIDVPQRTFNISTPIILFGLNDNGSISQFGDVNLYLIKFWKQGQLVLDARPSLNNGSPCLFDSVSNSYMMPTTNGFTYVQKNVITNVYCKVNDVWEKAVGTDIEDLQ